MTIRCIIHFAQTHPDFRLPELQSISELHRFDIRRPDCGPERGSKGLAHGDWDTLRPFWIVDLDEERHARILAERCILVKTIYELYAQGSNYDAVHVQTRANAHLWARFVEGASFRFFVSGYNRNISMRRQKGIIDAFRFMDLKGDIDLKNPDLYLAVLEEYPEPHTWQPRRDGDEGLLQIFFGRLIAEGTARNLIHKFDVKKRAYFGNTSMESEVSLLMANQTFAAPGKLIYDPFVGTGSMAYTAAHFGALVFGSDIDGRQMRGKGSSPGILVSARQYGVASRILDLCTFDVTKNPLRCGELFDAIVTDPPYGVRAGAKRLGRKNTEKRLDKRNLDVERTTVYSNKNHIPPTKPYELSQLVSDLVQLARHLLKPGGRLVFFLPTVTDEYEEVDIHTMLCEGMEVVANSLQNFGSWGRRLITIKKTTSQSFPAPFDDDEENSSQQEPRKLSEHVPAHRDFRVKYFKGFKKDGGVADPSPQCTSTPDGT